MERKTAFEAIVDSFKRLGFTEEKNTQAAWLGSRDKMGMKMDVAVSGNSIFFNFVHVTAIVDAPGLDSYDEWVEEEVRDMFRVLADRWLK